MKYSIRFIKNESIKDRLLAEGKFDVLGEYYDQAHTVNDEPICLTSDSFGCVPQQGTFIKIFDGWGHTICDDIIKYYLHVFHTDWPSDYQPVFHTDWDSRQTRDYRSGRLQRTFDVADSTGQIHKIDVDGWMSPFENLYKVVRVINHSDNEEPAVMLVLQITEDHYWS